MPADLTELQSAVETIPATSADARRGFSATNVTCSTLRNRLGVARLSNLIFMSLVGLSVEEFIMRRHM